MIKTIICLHCGKRRQKPPADGNRYPCPHRGCTDMKGIKTRKHFVAKRKEA